MLTSFKNILPLVAIVFSVFSTSAMGHHTETHFENSSPHKIVYQLNKADTDYIDHVLFSAGELLRKYGDDIEIVITAIGPGIHLLGKHPGRPIKPFHKQQVSSLATYGVKFHACGNTMKSLGWKEEDLIEEAIMVPIGAEDIMLLQEQGFSYLNW